MRAPPLCIIQARLHSTRLENKMLLTLGSETLIARGVRIARSAFYDANVVVAIPENDALGPLGDELNRLGATTFAYAGDEADVLGRFHACAHTYRWHPDSVIVRYTPDDPWKDSVSLLLVADGFRRPVEQGGEAFTLAQLTVAHNELADEDRREHITRALFPVAPPPAPNGRCWTIDTMADYEECRALIANGVAK